MVVIAGLTVFVPLVPAMLKVLPSLPLTVSEVAFVAWTVRVAEPPAVIELGSDVMVTAGTGARLKWAPPQPLSTIATDMMVVIGGSIRKKNRNLLTFIMVVPSWLHEAQAN